MADAHNKHTRSYTISRIIGGNYKARIENQRS
jgi:hypothetical protein